MSRLLRNIILKGSGLAQKVAGAPRPGISGPDLLLESSEHWHDTDPGPRSEVEPQTPRFPDLAARRWPAALPQDDAIENRIRRRQAGDTPSAARFPGTNPVWAI